MRSRRSFAAYLLVLVTGCPPTMNYAYQEKLPSSAFGPPEDAEQAGREARQLLSAARTVAFYPPDYCINVDKDEVARNRTLRANCGVLLSSLERAAEKAGYEVVSWQNLRGTLRPIDYAREAKVDVLFEINEFDFGPIDDAKVTREMAFFRYPESGNLDSYTPPSDVSSRCAVYAQGRRKTTTVGKVGTIDIKTVSVADGRNRWRYRKSLTRARPIEYERVAFSSAPTQNPAGKVLVLLGGVSLAIGGGLLLAETVSTDDPTTDADERVDFGSIDVIMIAAGAVALVGGFVVQGIAGKPGGSNTMCLSEGLPPRVTAAPTPIIDEEAENVAIRSEMIGDFVNVIVDVRNSMPTLAPPVEPVAPSTTPAPVPAPVGP